MDFDIVGFRRALGGFATGVAVATTIGTDGERYGITISSFNSVSLEPPLVLWSLGKSAISYEHFAAADHFAVHVLSREQKQLALDFAERGGNKFSTLDCGTGAGGVPILPSYSCCFECTTEHRYDGGDHTIIVGRVIAFRDHDKDPLIFHRGQFIGNGGVL